MGAEELAKCKYRVQVIDLPDGGKEGDKTGTDATTAAAATTKPAEASVVSI